MQDLYSEFQNPGAEYRGKPFWSWNGDLDREELLRQVRVMKEMGFGGYFMHSRTGLVTEYLGDEWFDLINACADEGEKLGMEAWLYDEDRWPSGTAGGMVTREARYRMKLLSCDVVGGGAFEWRDNLVAAFACRLDGVKVYEVARLRPTTPVKKYADRNVLAITVVEQDKSTFYNGYTYVDTLNRTATECFLRSTHEKYRKHCGDRLGRSINGIFTDEPHRGPLLTSFSSNRERPEWKLPWTPGIFAQFKRAFGYDLRSRLPELFLQLEGRDVSQVKWHYVELIQRLFIENFARPCREWCVRNNLILTGHVLHEDSLTAQTCMSGSVMRYYEHMDYPGIDILTEGNRRYWVAKQLSSVARQVGRKRLLSELYGCTGWQMPFAGHKHVGDWQALFGINLRCHHLSWYTMQGEAKRDYPASILHQSAWWHDYDSVETYFARIGVMMSQGKPCCGVLVINPIESVWCRFYPGWANGLSAKSPGVEELEKTYSKTFHWLCGAQIDFDYGDEELLSRLARVEKREGGPVLRVGEATYQTVVVAGLNTVRSSTLRLLDEFLSAGGKVIFAGDVPGYVDALPSDAPADLSTRAINTPLEFDTLTAAVDGVVPPTVRVSDPATGKPATDIFCQMRDVGALRVLMALNVNREKAYNATQFRVEGKGVVEAWDCLRGTRTRIPAVDADGYLTFTADFVEGGEHLFVIGPGSEAHVPMRERWGTHTTTAVPGPFEYALSEPNVCVLDFAEYGIDGGHWQPAAEVLKADRAVREQLGLAPRGGHMLQPWFVRSKGVTVRGRVAVRFRFAIREMPTGPIELAMEEPMSFETRINGTRLSTVTDQGWWVDRAFRRFVLPTSALRAGQNEITLTTDYHENSNLEAVYLLGQFGVEVHGSSATLTQLPLRIATGSITSQGLPFYGGAITLWVPPPGAPAQDEKLFLCIGQTAAACVKVQGCDGQSRLVGWAPYEVEITPWAGRGEAIPVQLVLTRRNTFGPLHQVPLHTANYGPGNFVTEGERFSADYNLLPNGLLHELTVETRKPIGD
ncbi:MAG: hypothetical protein GC164_02990 [Phycisphaera sp.]|nr:hypothetical protein [Phycisphaera sp.]